MPPAAWTPVAIALGSNLGDRRAHLDWAATRLATHLGSLTRSTWIETVPVGMEPGAAPCLNGVVTGLTTQSSRECLSWLLALELERGRTRPHRWASRTLDLDLILFGTEVRCEAGLVVPHPRFRDRLFVLEPLAEVAGTWTDPVTGRTVAALRDAATRPSAAPAAR